jgi:hypothetical protein
MEIYNYALVLKGQPVSNVIYDQVQLLDNGLAGFRQGFRQ